MSAKFNTLYYFILLPAFLTYLQPTNGLTAEECRAQRTTVATTTTTASPTTTPQQCPEGWMHVEPFCYKNLKKIVNYTNAKTACEGEDAHLPYFKVAKHFEDLLAVRLKLAVYSSFWLGLTDLQTEGTWLWDDGTPMTGGYGDPGHVYPWTPQDPDGIASWGCKECSDCVRAEVSVLFKWRDDGCDRTAGWLTLCQKDEEEQTTTTESTTTAAGAQTTVDECDELTTTPAATTTAPTVPVPVEPTVAECQKILDEVKETQPPTTAAPTTTVGSTTTGMLCPEGWLHVDPFCYKNTKKVVNYTNAKTACEAENAHLPYFKESQHFEDLLAAKLKLTVYQSFWIGLTDLQTEGTWLWDDGTPMIGSYGDPGHEYPWTPQDPDGVSSWGCKECSDCVRAEVSVLYKWRDDGCDRKAGWLTVCQMDVPATTQGPDPAASEDEAVEPAAGAEPSVDAETIATCEELVRNSEPQPDEPAPDTQGSNSGSAGAAGAAGAAAASGSSTMITIELTLNIRIEISSMMSAIIKRQLIQITSSSRSEISTVTITSSKTIECTCSSRVVEIIKTLVSKKELILQVSSKEVTVTRVKTKRTTSHKSGNKSRKDKSHKDKSNKDKSHKDKSEKDKSEKDKSEKDKSEKDKSEKDKSEKNKSEKDKSENDKSEDNSEDQSHEKNEKKTRQEIRKERIEKAKQERADRRTEARGNAISAVGGCYSLDDRVNTRGGEKKLRELKVGEDVLVTDGGSMSGASYQPVRWFLHRNSDTPTEFFQLTFKTTTLTLTPKHLLPLVPCGMKLDENTENLFNVYSVFAERAREGDCALAMADGKTSVEPILAVHSVNQTGFVAPITPTGTLIVNGIQTSCFAGYESHRLQSSIFRTLDRMSDLVPGLLDKTGAADDVSVPFIFQITLHLADWVGSIFR